MGSYSSSRTSIDNANNQVAAQDYGIANGRDGQIGQTNFKSSSSNKVAGGHVVDGDFIINTAITDNELMLFKSIQDSNKELFTQATKAFSESTNAVINQESPAIAIFDKIKMPVVVIAVIYLLVKIFKDEVR